MFGKLKNLFGAHDPGDTFIVYTPLEGEAVAMTEVNDPTFSEGLLGKGVAIKPSGGRVVSPVDGRVSAVFHTGHAVSVTSNDGVEVLIHVGLDTVKLGGRHFTVHAAMDDTVRAGDLLLSFDPDKIKEEGYDTITPVVITNSDDYLSVDVKSGVTVREKDEIMTVRK